MALVAKDFQDQAQWALVVIPAPIYFRCLRKALPDLLPGVPGCAADNLFFTAMLYPEQMIRQRTFGKLGNRKAARLSLKIDAGLVMPEKSERCTLENISRTGCRLEMSEPPRIGATVMIKVERIESLGVVTWVRHNRCGIKFSNILEVAAFERMRWIVENSNKHEQNSLTHATAVWR